MKESAYLAPLAEGYQQLQQLRKEVGHALLLSLLSHLYRQTEDPLQPFLPSKLIVARTSLQRVSMMQDRSVYGAFVWPICSAVYPQYICFATSLLHSLLADLALVFNNCLHQYS